MQNKATVAKMLSNGIEYLVVDDKGLLSFEPVEFDAPNVVWLDYEKADAEAQRYAANLNPSSRTVFIPVVFIPTVFEQ